MKPDLPPCRPDIAGVALVFIVGFMFGWLVAQLT